MTGIQSLTEILKQLLQTFQIHTLFPAATLTFITFLICPRYAFFKQKIEDGDIAICLIISTIILSNLFAAFNGLIIRFLEGYEHENNKIVYFFTGWFFSFLSKREEERYRKIKRELKNCTKDFERVKEIELYYERKSVLEKQPYSKEFAQIETLRKNITKKRNKLLIQLDTCFAPSRLQPTSFGNTILAFEYYPMKRYQMEGLCLWPCLQPILDEKKFTYLLNNEKSRLDLLLNSTIVSLIIGIEGFFLFLFYESDWRYLLLCGGFLFLICFFYTASVFAAKDWGTMVKAAFDLYRHDLYQALHLKPLRDGDLNEEKKVWHCISEFFMLGESEDFDGFFYSQQASEKKKEV
jgi:hypothetical protein